MGLELLHTITTENPYMARFELSLVDGRVWTSDYSSFSIDNEDNFYTIHVSGFSGTGDDIMNMFSIGGAGQNGMPFSTYDYGPRSGCASGEHGGFWYNSCDWFNMNADGWFAICIGPCYSSIDMSGSRLLIKRIR